jgi:broad specificity phosphatase PhoE
MYDRDERVTDDRVGNGLNGIGREQARLLGARLAALPIKIHEIRASDFKRARETAEEIGAVLGLKPVLDPLLHECTPSMEPDRGLASKQDMESCNAQLAELWAKYAKPTPEKDVYDALVAHGNVIRWLTMRALQADPRHWIALDIANASLTVIAIKANGSATLVQYSDASHIPYAKQTWSGAGPGWAPPKLTR